MAIKLSSFVIHLLIEMCVGILICQYGYLFKILFTKFLKSLDYSHYVMIQLEKIPSLIHMTVLINIFLKYMNRAGIFGNYTSN